MLGNATAWRASFVSALVSVLAGMACAHPLPPAPYQAAVVVRAFDDPEPVLETHDQQVLETLTALGYRVHITRRVNPRTLYIANGSSVIATRDDAAGKDSLVVTLDYYRSRDDRDPTNPFGPQSNSGFRYTVTAYSLGAGGLLPVASDRARGDADSVAAALKALQRRTATTR